MGGAGPELRGLGHRRRLHRLNSTARGHGGRHRDRPARNSSAPTAISCATRASRWAWISRPTWPRRWAWARSALQQMISRTALDNDGRAAGPDHLRRGGGRRMCAPCPPSAAPPASSTATPSSRPSATPAIARTFPGRNARRHDARPADPGRGRQFRRARRPMPRRSSCISPKSAPPIM